MNKPHYSAVFTVDRSPQDAFEAINNVRGWWSQATEGDTGTLGAVFYYHYQDIHRCTFKITELVPRKKVAWRVLHNAFSFTRDKTEWNGTEVVFEIAQRDGKTEVRFTHVGLVPAYECYDICSDAWGKFIVGSLRDLIVIGQGQPNPVEEHADHQEELVIKARDMSRQLQEQA